MGRHASWTGACAFLVSCNVIRGLYKVASTDLADLRATFSRAVYFTLHRGKGMAFHAHLVGLRADRTIRCHGLLIFHPNSSHVRDLLFPADPAAATAPKTASGDDRQHPPRRYRGYVGRHHWI